jgi:hypothetical protein
MTTHRVVPLTRVAALIVLTAGATSCAIAATKGPPSGHRTMTDFACTDSYTTPIIDAIGGLSMLPGGPVAAPYVISAFIGFRRASACKEAKELARKDFGAFMAQPAALRADVSIASVTLSGGGDTVRVGVPTAMRAAALTAGGAEIVGRQFVWTTSDSSVALVDSQGRVVGRVAGVTRVVAATGGVSATRTVVVVP